MKKPELLMTDLLSNTVLFSAIILVTSCVLLGDKLPLVAGDLVRTCSVMFQQLSDLLLSFLR